MASSPSPRGRQVTVVQALALLLAFVLTAGVGGLLTAGLVLPAVAATDTATDLSIEAFDDLPSELEPGPLSEKSTMLAADGTVLATFYSENRVVVSLEDVSEYMQQAVIATEDKRFYLHGAAARARAPRRSRSSTSRTSSSRPRSGRTTSPPRPPRARPTGPRGTRASSARRSWPSRSRSG